MPQNIIHITKGDFKMKKEFMNRTNKEWSELFGYSFSDSLIFEMVDFKPDYNQKVLIFTANYIDRETKKIQYTAKMAANMKDGLTDFINRTHLTTEIKILLMFFSEMYVRNKYNKSFHECFAGKKRDKILDGALKIVYEATANTFVEQIQYCYRQLNVVIPGSVKGI